MRPFYLPQTLMARNKHIISTDWNWRWDLTLAVYPGFVILNGVCHIVIWSRPYWQLLYFTVYFVCARFTSVMSSMRPHLLSSALFGLDVIQLLCHFEYINDRREWQTHHSCHRRPYIYRQRTLKLRQAHDRIRLKLELTSTLAAWVWWEIPSCGVLLRDGR